MFARQGHASHFKTMEWSVVVLGQGETLQTFWTPSSLEEFVLWQLLRNGAATCPRISIFKRPLEIVNVAKQTTSSIHLG